MRQQMTLKTNTWRTLLESVPSQFQKLGVEENGGGILSMAVAEPQGSNHSA